MVQSPFPLAILPSFALMLTTWFVMAYAMSVDAHTRGVRRSVATALGVVVALLPMGILAYYLGCGRLGPRQSPPTTRERAAWTLILAMTVAFVLGATFSPPDPFTQLSQLPIFLLLTFPVSYLVVFKNGWARTKTLVR